MRSESPQSLWAVLEIYQQYLLTECLAQTAKAIYSQTLTALTCHTLPAMGHPAPSGRKRTKAEGDSARAFMEGIALERLGELPTIQATGFQELQTPKTSQHTYSSRLRALLKWSEQQCWYPQGQEDSTQNCCPKKGHGFGTTLAKRTTTRRHLPSYSLKPEEISLSLQAELDEFYRFWTLSYYPGRKTDPLTPGSTRHHLGELRRILGWLHRYQGISLKALTFNLLVLKVSLKSFDNRRAMKKAEKSAADMEKWLCLYLGFLAVERKSKSAGTLMKALAAVHTLIRFQYQQETDDPAYSDIPAMKRLRIRLWELRRKRRNQVPVADETLKWLDLPDVLQKIVAPLRQECAYRHSTGSIRSIQAIASSFQTFIIWGCLTFRPPRRQQEFRNLKFATACPIQRPKDVAAGQLIHPLPSDRAEDKLHGYLYKAPDGNWYMDMTPESYKTGPIYGHQQSLMQNPSFPDGKCFYDYLEAFLYGYYRKCNGNWRSGGQLIETPRTEGQWCSLRMSFDGAEHNYVFARPRTGKPFSQETFYGVVRNSAHRLSGQLITPHLLRDIYVTWFLDQDYTDSKISSLAYSLGHSEAVLRDIYDRRRPKQKNRPIEEVVLSLVQQYVS